MATKKAQSRAKEDTMASKKTSNSNSNKAAPSNNGAPAQKTNRQIVDEKFPNHPPRARELIAEGMTRKLIKSEIAELRTWKLKKDGSAISTHSGPREKSGVNVQAVANVIEFAGIDGLRKMHERHGVKLRRALKQHIASLAEGSDDRTALEAVARVLFPSQRKGFAKKDHQTVSKAGRVAVLVSDVAAPGSIVKREVVVLPDGRRGVFVYAAGVEQAPAPSTDALPPAAAAPAWAAPPSA